MFEKIAAAPADPILGLTEEFKKDTRSDKINLGVGVFKTEDGKTPILNCVKKAEKRILESENTKSYLSIAGVPGLDRLVQDLIFSSKSDVVASSRARTVQAPGGTGALRIGGDFIHQQNVSSTIWISDPTWANHMKVFGAAGLKIERYKYYNKETHSFDLQAALDSLKAAKPGDTVLFHGCCHNPTGSDPSAEEWETLGKFTAERGLLPFFDFAYQGFSKGLEEDAAGVRTFEKYHKEFIVANSFSKNFGLYNERIGGLTVVCANSGDADKAFSQMKIAVRANFSNPPAHGGKIVAEVLSDPELKKEWEDEVKAMRDRILDTRKLFVEKLKAEDIDWGFIVKQNGMFSFTGLTPEQVDRIKADCGVYCVRNGRINVAGISTKNVDALVRAIKHVLA